MLTSNSRMVVLDGSRGFAALFVVLAHGLMTYRLVPLATVAVDYFFVLSGLVLASAYGARLRDGSMTFGRFFVVRFVRLYPMITLGVIMGAMVFLRSQWLRLDEAHLDRLAAAIAAGKAHGLNVVAAVSLLKLGAAEAKKAENGSRLDRTIMGETAAAQAVRRAGFFAALRALQAVGFTVTSIQDVTPVPHNGCRPRKRRRV